MGMSSPALIWLAGELEKLEPASQLGGIYAFKKGYHSSRRDNQVNWPGNYSILISADQEGSDNYGAAIDWTFPDAQSERYATIDKYSSRLLAAGQRNDPRTRVLREFYGQADSDTAVEGWDFWYRTTSTSDSSHLWHIHKSFLRKYANDMNAMKAVLSVLKGETLDQWLGVGMADYTESQMRAFPWQYNGNGMRGVPDLKSTLWVFGEVYSNTLDTNKHIQLLRAEVAAMAAKVDALQTPPAPVITVALTQAEVAEAVKMALREGTA